MRISSCIIVILFTLLALGMPFLMHASKTVEINELETSTQVITELSWEKDIRPTLESLICVNERESSADPKAKVYEIILEKKGREGLDLLVWSGVGGIYYGYDKDHYGKECQNWKPDPPNQILREIADIFLSKRHVVAQYSCWEILDYEFIREKVLDIIEHDENGIKVSAPIGIVLLEEGWQAKKYRPKNADAVWENFFQVLFTNRNVLQVIMPPIHTFLKAEGIDCPDCPGPSEGFKSQSISLSDLIPYLAQSYQLSSVPKAETLFRIIPIDQTENPHLALAAKALSAGNTEALQRATSLAWEVKRTKEYRKVMKKKPESEKLAYLNTRLTDLLIEDKEFLSESLRWAKIILPELNIDCKDCTVM